MRAEVRDSLHVPIVYRTARSIVADAPARDELTDALHIRRWVLAHFKFLKDPAGLELLYGPVHMLHEIQRYGAAQGDCDEAATLTSALLLAVGIPAKFVAAGFSANGPFTHVYALGYPLVNGGRQAVEMDITRPASIPNLPSFQRKLVVTV